MTAIDTISMDVIDIKTYIFREMVFCQSLSHAFLLKLLASTKERLTCLLCFFSNLLIYGSLVQQENPEGIKTPSSSDKPVSLLDVHDSEDVVLKSKRISNKQTFEKTGLMWPQRHARVKT